MNERAGWAVLSGTLLVVVGVALISWKPEGAPSSYRWWQCSIR